MYQVPRGLGLAQPVAHSSGQCEVVFVVLHCFDVVAHVEIGVAQLHEAGVVKQFDSRKLQFRDEN